MEPHLEPGSDEALRWDAPEATLEKDWKVWATAVVLTFFLAWMPATMVALMRAQTEAEFYDVAVPVAVLFWPLLVWPFHRLLRWLADRGPRCASLKLEGTVLRQPRRAIFRSSVSQLDLARARRLEYSQGGIDPLGWGDLLAPYGRTPLPSTVRVVDQDRWTPERIVLSAYLPEAAGRSLERFLLDVAERLDLELQVQRWGGRPELVRGQES